VPYENGRVVFSQALSSLQSVVCIDCSPVEEAEFRACEEGLHIYMVFFFRREHIYMVEQWFDIYFDHLKGSTEVGPDETADCRHA
jgi:hypothetical protein